MVSLGVPTARFGSPPDPDKPEPHYPGVSANKFDALGALKVYRENLKRDADIRANQLLGKRICAGFSGTQPLMPFVLDLEALPAIWPARTCSAQVCPGT